MNFDNVTEKASCPYNSSHIFDKEKLIFHLNRCKDKEKVGHLFTSCQFNRIHIVLKEDIQTHEIICPDKEDIKRLTTELRETLITADEERERSREKMKKEAKEEYFKKEVKTEKHDHPSDYVHYESCGICMRTVSMLEDIKKVVPPETLAKIKTVEKMIKMNQSFIQAELGLRNN